MLTQVGSYKQEAIDRYRNITQNLLQHQPVCSMTINRFITAQGGGGGCKGIGGFQVNIGWMGQFGMIYGQFWMIKDEFWWKLVNFGGLEVNIGWNWWIPSQFGMIFGQFWMIKDEFWWNWSILDDIWSILVDCKSILVEIGQFCTIYGQFGMIFGQF